MAEKKASKKPASKTAKPKATKSKPKEIRKSDKEIVLDKYPKPVVGNIGKLFVLYDKQDGKKISSPTETVEGAFKLAAHRILIGL